MGWPEYPQIATSQLVPHPTLRPPPRLIGHGAVLAECKGNPSCFQGTEKSNYPGIRAGNFSVRITHERNPAGGMSAFWLKLLRPDAAEKRKCWKLWRKDRLCFSVGPIKVPPSKIARPWMQMVNENFVVTAAAPRAGIKSITSTRLYVLRSLLLGIVSWRPFARSVQRNW